MKDQKNKPPHRFTRHQEIQIWCIIAIAILIAVTNVAFAKTTPTTKNCLQLGKQYRHAVRTNSPARHRLVERLWVECGK
jgi:hypothetical protein